MNALTRRYMLGCIASASALAGCASNSTTSAQFDQVTTDGTSLIIELETAEGIDELSIINPDGAAFSTVEATAGQTRYSIELGTAYTPGEYEINAIVDEEIAATTTMALRPDIEIIDVGVGENYPDQVPDDLPFPDTQVIMSAQNIGTGPGAVTNLEITGNVPNPTTREDQDDSGIFDIKNGYGEVTSLKIGANEEVRFFSSTQPFARQSNSCEDGPLRIRLVTDVSEGVVSEVYSADYQNTSQSDCSVSIQEGE